jgi:hypothetical protein
MNTLRTICPPGSGNTFLRQVIEKNIYCDLLHTDHKYTGDNSINQIFILRNPYDCIASGIERLTMGSKDKYAGDQFNVYDLNLFNFHLKDQIQNYKNFILNVQDKEKIFCITFEFLTQNTYACTIKIANYFNFKNIDNKSMSNDAKSDLINSGLKSRLPRKKSNTRIYIDNILNHDEDLKELFALYSIMFNRLQSTENMV